MGNVAKLIPGRFLCYFRWTRHHLWFSASLFDYSSSRRPFSFRAAPRLLFRCNFNSCMLSLGFSLS